MSAIDYKIIAARTFIKEIRQLAQKYDVNFFVVTDGASCIRNNGNAAVRYARECHIKWEKENGYNPYEDFEEEEMILCL